jgi:hypothetical protein
MGGKGKFRNFQGHSAERQGAKGQDCINPGVPTLNGDPDKFQAFVQSCEWYQQTLKSSERHLAAAKIWGNLRGPARMAAARLSASELTGQDGPQTILDFLVATPLAKQPLPDAYRKIEEHRNVRRSKNDTAAEYVLREQESYDKMIDALRRLRRRDDKTSLQRHARQARREEKREKDRQ